MFIKKTYKIIYTSNLIVKEALKKVEDEIEAISEVKEILTFFRGSERGVIR